MPETAAPELRLRVANDPVEIQAARSRALAFLSPQALSARTIFRFEVVLEEMLMNRLMHAFPDGGQHATEVTLTVASDALQMHLVDDGIPFDPTQAAPRERPASLLHAEPGGYGLLLTRRYARTCTYARIGERNHLLLELARD